MRDSKNRMLDRDRQRHVHSSIVLAMIVVAIATGLACWNRSYQPAAAVVSAEETESSTQSSADAKGKEETMAEKVEKSEREWKEILSPEQYCVLREKGTERAFTGKYYKTKDDGVYRCAACGNPLFSSEHKFDSGSGWPSFYQAIDEGRVKLAPDTSHGMFRIEVVCGHCGSHLGHVFDDGPEPTGKRYCINSLSLDFDAAKEQADKP